MQLYQWKSERAKKEIAKLRAEGKREGRREGRAEGRRKGRSAGRSEGVEEGRILAQQDAAVRIAEIKLGKLSAKHANLIRGMRNERRLLALIVKLSRATSKLQARNVLRALS